MSDVKNILYQFLAPPRVNAHFKTNTETIRLTRLLLAPAVLSICTWIYGTYVQSDRHTRDSGLFVCVMRNGRLVASWFAHHMATARQRITASVLHRPQTRSFFYVGFLFSALPLLLFSHTDWKERIRNLSELSETSLLIVKRLRSCLVQKYEVSKAFQGISILIIILI